jgi:hypothetical protein
MSYELDHLRTSAHTAGNAGEEWCVMHASVSIVLPGGIESDAIDQVVAPTLQDAIDQVVHARLDPSRLASSNMLVAAARRTSAGSAPDVLQMRRRCTVRIRPTI